MSKLRYQLTQNGISPRWIPGSFDESGNPNPICFANGDEHDELGSVDESSQNAILMADKRKLKEEEIKKYLPQPEVFGPEIASLSFVGFGSTKNVIIDVINFVKNYKLTSKSTEKIENTKTDLLIQKLNFKNNIWADLENLINDNPNFEINYLSYSYICPLQTEKLTEFMAKNTNICLIEGNGTGQLGKLIKMETGLDFSQKLLKYDGRQFFVEDILEFICSQNKV